MIGSSEREKNLPTSCMTSFISALLSLIVYLGARGNLVLGKEHVSAFAVSRVQNMFNDVKHMLSVKHM